MKMVWAHATKHLIYLGERPFGPSYIESVLKENKIEKQILLSAYKKGLFSNYRPFTVGDLMVRIGKYLLTKRVVIFQQRAD
jgi:hypothetical protein